MYVATSYIFYDTYISYDNIFIGSIDHQHTFKMLINYYSLIKNVVILIKINILLRVLKIKLF